MLHVESLQHFASCTYFKDNAEQQLPMCVSAALQRVNFSRINTSPNPLHRCLPLFSSGVFFSTRGLHCSLNHRKPAVRASTSQKRLVPFNHRHLALPCLPPPPRNNYTQTSTPPSSVRAHIRLLLSLLLLASLATTSPRPDRYSYSLVNCQSILLPDSRAATSSDRLLPDLDVCAQFIASQ